MRDLTEYESELVLDALAGYMTECRRHGAVLPAVRTTADDLHLLRSEFLEDHGRRFGTVTGVTREGRPPSAEPPTIHICTRCGVTVQELRGLGWASTSTGGLECGFPRQPHEAVERCKSTSAEGTRCELPMPGGPGVWTHGGSATDPNAAHHRGTNREGRRVRWACGNGQPEQPVPATCESCGADQATMWDQSCPGSVRGSHTWRHEGDAPSAWRPDEEAAVAQLTERLERMLEARRERPKLHEQSLGEAIEEGTLHPDDEVVDAPITCNEPDLIGQLAGDAGAICIKDEGHELPHEAPDGATWSTDAQGNTTRVGGRADLEAPWSGPQPGFGCDTTPVYKPGGLIASDCGGFGGPLVAPGVGCDPEPIREVVARPEPPLVDAQELERIFARTPLVEAMNLMANTSGPPEVTFSKGRTGIEELPVRASMRDVKLWLEAELTATARAMMRGGLTDGARDLAGEAAGRPPAVAPANEGPF